MQAGIRQRILMRQNGDNWLVVFPTGAMRVMTDTQTDKLFALCQSYNRYGTSWAMLSHNRMAIDTPYIPPSALRIAA